MKKGEIIAIWGNSNSGKTTTSIKLAMELANKRKNVLIVLTDISAPDLSVIQPFEKADKSMGIIWSDPDISSEKILKECVLTKSQYITMLGYKHGENIFSNSEYTKANIVKIMQLLKTVVDYIIIDCYSNFASDILSTVALEMADEVIRLCEVNLKAVSFFDSNLSMLADSRFRESDHIKVLSKVKINQAKDIAVNMYSDITAALPFVDEIEEQMLTGELFSIIKNKNTTVYNQSIKKLTKIILNEETDDKPDIKEKISHEKKKASKKPLSLTIKKKKDDIDD